MKRWMAAAGALGCAIALPLAAAAAAAGEDPDPRALIHLGAELEEALQFDAIILVALQLGLLFAALKLAERAVALLVRWRATGSAALDRWVPSMRLGAAILAVFIVVTAITPEHPSARALVLVGVVVALLWSGREVLRNAAAGAVLIARQAVRPGEYLQVGAHRGRVASITLRGVELIGADGTHTFVPGVALHTSAATYAPAMGSAAPVIVRWSMTAAARAQPADAIRRMAWRLAALSPRRAPGSPVRVVLDEAAGVLMTTLTPFDSAEEAALQDELERRYRDAWPIAVPDEVAVTPPSDATPS